MLYPTILQSHGQSPLSMRFPGQEYWSGLLFPSPGDVLILGMEPTTSALAGGFFTTESPGKSKTIEPAKTDNISYALVS